MFHWKQMLQDETSFLSRLLEVLVSPGAEGLDMDGAELLQALLVCVCVCQRLHVCWGTGIR